MFRRKKDKTPIVTEKTNKIAVGLDIGTTKVAVCVGQRNKEGKIELLGSGEHLSLGVQRGQVINIVKTVEAINHAIKQANISAGVAIDTVVAGIAGQHINSFHAEGEIKRRDADTEVSKEDVKMLIEDMFKISVKPGVQIIDAIPQEFFVDNYNDLKDPIGVLGTQLGSIFNIITGNSQHIKNIARCIQKCNLKMEGLVLEPIASAEVVLDEREKESGVALVDIGGGTTDIAVFYNGILRHSAVIPIGGDVITDDIKTVFKGIIKENAEAIKLKYGSCIADKSKPDHIISVPGIKGRPPINIQQIQLAEVIAARVNEIIERIMVEIRNSDYAKKLGCGLVLTGGGALLNAIKEFTEFKTGLSVRIGNPEEKIIHKQDSKINNPIYSTALGLMVMGVEKEEEDIIKTYEENENSKTTDSTETERKRKTIRSTTKYGTWDKVKALIDTLLDDVDEKEEEDDDDDFDN
ncbi:MAG: cell division protein FtsA [Bacteroidales bacterium]|jgi:cell division protein FtsA|nr:cell division protein FtsA [Bacteroidales bacterium]MDD2687836.1 cell division protein FtsA [Bacteroidales bacterium]MDD3330635.1 cell division protein FtsA [Bacteroidales bacterium]MDD3691577.1 cell division protein FtsA [Bacteroidales bacterium]MDD4045019.1 cell division protein FtsA [Bacteroidales bacterium]